MDADKRGSEKQIKTFINKVGKELLTVTILKNLQKTEKILVKVVYKYPIQTRSIN